MEKSKSGARVAGGGEHLDGLLGHAREDLRAGLKEKFSRAQLDRGQFVFFEGDASSALYIVESGVIEANVIHGDGKVYIFHFIFPGEVFGEGVLYGQEHVPFSAVARREASIHKISREDLLPFLEQDPGFERHLLRMVGAMLDGSYVKARCIAGERVERRVACILLKTLDESAGMYGCGERLDSHLTNRDISGLIGSTEETVSRVMSRLKKEGIVGTKDKQLVVLDKEALMQFLESV